MFAVKIDESSIILKQSLMPEQYYVAAAEPEEQGGQMSL
jgi:hypothetical protein